MEFLTEDPTYLMGGLGLLAVVFLIALKVTQQGKFLIWAGGVLGLAVLALAIDWLWVTDTERIEQVVYDLKGAVARSDANGVIAHLAPEAQFAREEMVVSGEPMRAYVRSNLEKVKFEILRITKLRATAMRQARRGTADFRIVASGTYQTPIVTYNFGATNLDWSLGFRETAPGVWKVERISLTRAPKEVPVPPGAGPSQGDSPRFRLRVPRGSF